MRVPVKTDPYAYAVTMNEDGEFHCPHENVEIEYDRGGDGITEPGQSWSVYCTDCHNDDMADYQIDDILQAHWDNEQDNEE